MTNYCSLNDIVNHFLDRERQFPGFLNRLIGPISLHFKTKRVHKNSGWMSIGPLGDKAGLWDVWTGRNFCGRDVVVLALARACKTLHLESMAL